MWGEGKKEDEGRRNLKDREERWIGFEETGRRWAVAIARNVSTAVPFPATAVEGEEMLKGIYSVWMKKKKKKIEIY